MDEPLAVGVLQCLGNRGDQFGCLAIRGPFVLDLVGQRTAFDELRDDEAGAVIGAAHIVNGDDVRMLEAGDRASFDQVGFSFLGGYSMPMRHLDRHEPLQLIVVG